MLMAGTFSCCHVRRVFLLLVNVSDRFTELRSWSNVQKMSTHFNSIALYSSHKGKFDQDQVVVGY